MAKLTILYIGDDITSVRLIEQALQPEGYSFTHVNNALDGIAAVIRRNPDLIFVDTASTEIDSPNLIARLRIIPGIKEKPIIVVAALSQLDGHRLALVSGCDGYITKPISVKQLFAQLNRFLKLGPQSPSPTVQSTDIIKQLEAKIDELTETNQRLQQANGRLQELDRQRAKFFNVVSHDLRTPFTPIRGYIDLLRDGAMGELNTKQQQAVNIVAENLKNALRLLDDLLDLSKLQMNGITLSLELFSVQDLLGEVTKSGKAYVENRDVVFEVEIQDELPPIYGDVGRIRQVLFNLLNNAAKFTDRGCIKLIAKSEQDEITIQVKDTGSGLLPEEIPRVFTEFWQSDTIRANGIGTGLGLAISQHLIQAHKGRIWLESEKEVGTTVSFVLPVAKIESNV